MHMPEQATEIPPNTCAWAIQYVKYPIDTFTFDSSQATLNGVKEEKSVTCKLYNEPQCHDWLIVYTYFLQMFVLLQMFAHSHVEARLEYIYEPGNLVDILGGNLKMYFLLDGLVASCLHM